MRFCDRKDFLSSLILSFLIDMILLILNENQKQTRKLAAGCSKHCFEVVDRTDRVSIIYLW